MDKTTYDGTKARIEVTSKVYDMLTQALHTLNEAKNAELVFGSNETGYTGDFAKLGQAIIEARTQAQDMIDCAKFASLWTVSNSGARREYVCEISDLRGNGAMTSTGDGHLAIKTPIGVLSTRDFTPRRNQEGEVEGWEYSNAGIVIDIVND